jgi:hypothetical protein
MRLRWKFLLFISALILGALILTFFAPGEARADVPTMSITQPPDGTTVITVNGVSPFPLRVTISVSVDFIDPTPVDGLDIACFILTVDSDGTGPKLPVNVTSQLIVNQSGAWGRVEVEVPDAPGSFGRASGVIIKAYGLRDTQGGGCSGDLASPVISTIDVVLGQIGLEDRVVFNQETQVTLPLNAYFDGSDTDGFGGYDVELYYDPSLLSYQIADIPGGAFAHPDFTMLPDDSLPISSSTLTGTRLVGLTGAIPGPNGFFNLSMVTFNILGSGSTTIYVAVNDYIDTSGDSHLPLSYIKSARLNIIGDTQSPQVAITYPDPGECFTNSTLVVSGTVDDPEPSYGLESVLVNSVTATISGNTFTATISLVPGLNTLTATARDSYSNTGSDSVVVIMDTADPSVAITSPNSGECINSTTVVVSGTASDSGESGIAVVLVNGITAAGTYTWSIIFTDQTGPATYQATVIDNCGNMGGSNPITINIDTDPPLVNIASPFNGECINSTTVVVSGTATDLNGVAQVLVNTQSASLDGDSWSITFFDQSGAPTYEVVAIDNCGNNSVPATVNITIDPEPPSVAIDSPMSGECINSTTVVVNGTVSDLLNAVEKVWVNGETASGTEFWSVTLTDQNEGYLTISAIATDTCNNLSSPTVVDISIDISPPIVSIVIPDTAPVGTEVSIQGNGLSGASSVKFGDSESPSWSIVTDAEIIAQVPSGVGIVDVKVTDSCGNVGICPNCFIYVGPSVVITSPEEGECVNVTAVPVSGSFDKFPDSSQVNVLVNGYTAITVPTGPQSGTFSVTLPGGPSIITAFASDGSNFATDTNIIDVDTSPPSVSITRPSEGEKLNNSTVLIKGDADDENGIKSVNISLDGGPLQEAEYRPSTQLWFIELAVADGPHTLEATATDDCGSGNEDTTLPRSFWVDTADPTATISSPSPGQILSDNTVTVSGSVSDPEPSSGIASVKVNGVTAEVSEDNFTATLLLSEGAQVIWAVVVDNAGNFEVSPDVGIFIDTQSPVVEIIPPPPSLICQPTLIVTGEVNDPPPSSGLESVTVFINGTPVPAFLEGSIFSATVTLIPGPNIVYASAEDHAGNQMMSSPWGVTLDNIPPVVVIISPSDGTLFGAADDGDSDPANGFQTAVTVSTDAEDGQNVTLSINGLSFHYQLVSGGIAFFPAVTLFEGFNSLEASVSDLAGNHGISSTIQVKVDTIPPVISFVYPQNGMIMGPGDDSDNNLANGLQIDITVSTDAEPGMTVTLIIIAVGPPTIEDAPVVGGGALFLGVTLSEGQINHLTATVTDEAGNIGNTEIEVTVPYLGIISGNTTIDLEWDQSILYWLRGVNVYRSLSLNGDYEKLNEEEIENLIGMLTDKDYLKSVRHFYWFTRVDEEGQEYRGSENRLWGKPLWSKNPEFAFNLVEARKALMMESPASTTFMVNLLPADGFAYPVTAEVYDSSPPLDMSISVDFDPNPLPPPFPATMSITFTTGTSTPPETYNITIRATGGPVTNIKTVTVPLILDIIESETNQSSISLIAHPTTLEVSETVEIYGKISPSHSGETVSITLTSPSIATTLAAVSDADGEYSIEYVPMAKGPWTIICSWDGEASILGATSLPYQITVEKAETNITLDDLSNAQKINDVVNIQGEVFPCPGSGNVHLKVINPDKTTNFEGDLALAGDCTFSQGFVVTQAGYVKVEVSYAGTAHFAYSEAEVTIPIQQPIGAAVIVAGGGDVPANTLWTATDDLCDYVYRTLINRNFPKDRIRYFHPHPSNNDADNDGDATNDVYATPTLAGIQDAIENWAMERVEDFDLPYNTPLNIYLMGPGENNLFYITDSVTVSASSLTSWLNTLSTTVEEQYTPTGVDPAPPYPTNVIIESQEAGSFIDELTRSGRIVIASTDISPDGEINISGNKSFSQYFFNKISAGKVIDDAWAYANLAILTLGDTFPHQTPQIEAEGDGIANEEGDRLGIAATRYLGYESTGDMRPIIKGVKTPATLNNISTASLYAIVQDLEDEIDEVEALIVPPPDSLDSLTTLGLTKTIEYSDGREKYEETYDQFNYPGVYDIYYLATDQSNNAAIPERSQVTVNDTIAPDDASGFNYYQTLTDLEDYAQIMADSRHIILYWTASPSVGEEDFMGYYLYQDSGSGYVLIDTLEDYVTNYEVFDLDLAITYSFKLEAYDWADNKSSGVTVGVHLDSDGDGLPNCWEEYFGLDPDDDGSTLLVNGASGDPDGDGLTNLEELSGGQNPQLFAMLVGDVNLDGKVDGEDSRLEHEYINGLLNEDPDDSNNDNLPPTAAVTPDTEITIGDVVFLNGFSQGDYPGSDLSGPTGGPITISSASVNPSSPAAGSTVTLTVNVIETLSEPYPLTLRGIKVSFEITEGSGNFPYGTGVGMKLKKFIHIPIDDPTGDAEVTLVLDPDPGDNNQVKARIEIMDAAGSRITIIEYTFNIVGNGTG